MQQLSVLYNAFIKTKDPANLGDFVRDAAGNYITKHGAKNSDIPSDAPPNSQWVHCEDVIDGHAGISFLNEAAGQTLGEPRVEMCKSGARAFRRFPVVPKTP